MFDGEEGDFGGGEFGETGFVESGKDEREEGRVSVEGGAGSRVDVRREVEEARGEIRREDEGLEVDGRGEGGESHGDHFRDDAKFGVIAVSDEETALKVEAESSGAIEEGRREGTVLPAIFFAGDGGDHA